MVLAWPINYERNSENFLQFTVSLDSEIKGSIASQNSIGNLDPIAFKNCSLPIKCFSLNR